MIVQLSLVTLRCRPPARETQSSGQRSKLEQCRRKNAQKTVLRAEGQTFLALLPRSAAAAAPRVWPPEESQRETRAGKVYHARMARRAQHLRCEGSKRADNKLYKAKSASENILVAAEQLGFAAAGSFSTMTNVWQIALTRALRARRARPQSGLFSCFAAARAACLSTSWLGEFGKIEQCNF